MSLYRKRPIIVEAEQWFPGKEIIGVRRVPANRVDLSKTRGILVDRPERHVVDTLEGEMQVSLGDWIVTGMAGEQYPVKDHIFQRSYDPVSANVLPSIGLRGLFGRKKK